jgi:hypothetical protein
MRHYAGPFALVLCAAAAGCGGRAYVSTKRADLVLVDRERPPGEMRAAIVRALEGRKFAAESEEPGRIVARLDKGDRQLRVAVEYTPAQYKVTYVSSRGFETRPGPDGEVFVEDRWFKWVKGLRARIGEELEASTRRADRAARPERDSGPPAERPRAEPSPVAAPAPPALPLPALPAPPALDLRLRHQETHGSSRITCCVNGARYVCPDQESFQRCMGLSPHDCARDEGRSCN